MDERVERVRAKVAARGVRLDPAVPEHEVAAFEAESALTLPEAYRAFLVEVGNGPADRVDREVVYGDPVPPEQVGGWNQEIRGRRYAVRPEHQAERERREGPPGYGLLPLAATVVDEEGQPLRPAATFPLTAAWVWEGEAQVDEDRRRAVFRDGHLYLGTEGGGEYWVLVVTGEERGRVWVLTDVGAQPCAPPGDFIDWYERWLDGRPYWSDSAGDQA